MGCKGYKIQLNTYELITNSAFESHKQVSESHFESKKLIESLFTKRRKNE